MQRVLGRRMMILLVCSDSHHPRSARDELKLLNGNFRALVQVGLVREKQNRDLIEAAEFGRDGDRKTKLFFGGSGFVPELTRLAADQRLLA